MSKITLQLDVFEGPLDLLLYLIKKNDLDVSKISLVEVTGQYLEYLENLRELDIDIASDYLYMAAELALIKSRALLPNMGQESEDEEDPTGDILSKLREYQKFKELGVQLSERNWLNRDTFTRGSFFEDQESEKPKKQKQDDGSIEYDVDSFELVKAFQEALNRLPKEEQGHKVEFERVSVTDRIYEVLDELRKHESVLFSDLFKADRKRIDIVITFLSILEMGKLKMVRIYQSSVFEPIRIQRKIELSDEKSENVSLDENLDDYS